MRLRFVPFASFALAFAWVGVVACGGTTAPLPDPAGGSSSGGSGSGSGGSSGSSSSGSGGGGSSGSSSGVVPPSEVPQQHRPAPVSCPSNSTGGVPCNSDAECNSGNPGVTPNYCFQGHCGPDQCQNDGDCAGGDVCSCAGQTRGYAGASPGNVCLPGNCRVDSDCGPGAWCSPSVSSSCGSFYGIQGYYCHRAGDACMNDSDCPATVNGGPAPYCAYDTSVGRWACGDSFCAG